MYSDFLSDLSLLQTINVLSFYDRLSLVLCIIQENIDLIKESILLITYPNCVRQNDSNLLSRHTFYKYTNAYWLIYKNILKYLFILHNTKWVYVSLYVIWCVTNEFFIFVIKIMAFFPISLGLYY